MLELVGDFFGRKKKCVVAGMSGVGPPGAHEAGGAPCTLVAKWWVPLVCSKCQKFLNILQKSYSIFKAFGELLFLGCFFIAWIIHKTDMKYYFALFILINRN